MSKKAFVYYEVRNRITWESSEHKGNFATLAAAKKFITDFKMKKLAFAPIDMYILEHNFIMNPDNTITDNQQVIEV